MKTNKKTIIINSVIIGVMLVLLTAFTALIANIDKMSHGIETTAVYSYCSWDDKKENLYIDMLGDTVVANFSTAQLNGETADIETGDIIEIIFEDKITIIEGKTNYLTANPSKVTIKKRSVKKAIDDDMILLTFSHRNSLSTHASPIASFFAENGEKPSYSAIIVNIDGESITIKFPKDEAYIALKSLCCYKMEITEQS